MDRRAHSSSRPRLHLWHTAGGWKQMGEQSYNNKPQVDRFRQSDRPSGGFSGKPLASIYAMNRFLDIPYPGISLLQVGSLKKVVLLLGRSELEDELE